METVVSGKLMITIMLPAIAALWIMFFSNKPNLRDSGAIAGAILTFFSVLWMIAPKIIDGGHYSFKLFELVPGVNVSFYIDGLGLLFAGTASFLWILAAIYCIGYMRGLSEHAQTRFYFCYAAAVCGAMGAAFSANLFTLYLFYEIVSIMTYPLVAHHQDSEAYEGSRKYIIYLMFTSKAFLLPAMALIYYQCGTLDFATSGIAAGIFPSTAPSVLVTSVYFLCLFGFAKAAIMPFHNWLPSAMVAPTPVSALLHAVVVVKVGVFSICRVMLSVFGVNLLAKLNLGIATAYIVSFTIIAASMIALSKTDLKARLAYSTVSQLSYIILGVAMLTPNSITGGVIHITNHALSKITLFFCAGAIFVATKKKDIRDMKGIGYQMPLTMAAFGLASLSMIGVPPVSGFVTKWFLALGTMDINNMILLMVLLASSFLNACYFSPVFIGAFSRKPEQKVNLEKKPLVAMMVVPLFITALCSVCAGIWPDVFLKIIKLLVNTL
ncbi:MAG: cation:proton antiporter [Deltaproteobacteria bacterium]|nr:MAG: cation:proton antiporter [Deltaproteobacteria bacterium]